MVDKSKHKPGERLKVLEDKIAKLEKELQQTRNENQKLQKRVMQVERKNVNLKEQMTSSLNQINQKIMKN